MNLNLSKKQKAILIAAAVFAALSAALLLRPVQNAALVFAQKVLLGRELRTPEKWIFLMKKIGAFGIFFAIFLAAFFVIFDFFPAELKSFLKAKIFGAKKKCLQFLKDAFWALKNFSKTSRAPFFFGAFYGVLAFLFVYGAKVLNPKYDAWLLTGGDLSQEYIGWISYRLSAWHFPLGLMEKLSYPNLASVVYTDSIPFFAFFFKLLSPLLPKTFQYFGFYGIFSFAMMGGVSCLLIWKCIKNLKVSLAICTLFVFSPWVFQRMYGHTSLAGGQWMIVAAIYLWLFGPQNSQKKNCAFWAGLLFLMTVNHPYFVPMGMVFCFANGIEDFFNKKRAFAAKRFLLSALSVALSLFVLGAFSKADPSGGGLGYFSANLNSLFNPQGTSVFLKTLKYTSGQYEGYGYLGLGAIAIFFAAAFYGLCVKKNPAKKIPRERIFSMLAAFSIFFVLALSPKIVFGDRVLFEFKLPFFAEKAYSVFRSSGRFIWACGYIIFFVSSVTLYFAMSERRFKKLSVFVLAALLQFADLSVWIDSIRQTKKYREVENYDSRLNEEVWTKLFFEKKHLIFQPWQSFNYENGGRQLTHLALKNGLDVNTFYFARPDTESMENFSRQIEGELKGGTIRRDAIYVFESSTPWLSEFPLFYYLLDGKIVGLSQNDFPLENAIRFDANSDLSKIADLLEYLEKIRGTKYAVFICVRDEASGGISKEALAALSGLGLSKSLEGKWRYSYLAAMNGGEILFENLGEEKLEFSASIGGVDFFAASAGMNCGNMASVKICETECAKNLRGLNIVVFDCDRREVVDSVAFDTCDAAMKAYR